MRGRAPCLIILFDDQSASQMERYAQPPPPRAGGGGCMDVPWGRVNTMSSQGLQLTIDSLIAFCNVQDEEEDEVSADSSQNSEDGIDLQLTYIPTLDSF